MKVVTLLFNCDSYHEADYNFILRTLSHRYKCVFTLFDRYSAMWLLSSEIWIINSDSGIEAIEKLITDSGIHQEKLVMKSIFDLIESQDTVNTSIVERLKQDDIREL